MLAPRSARWAADTQAAPEDLAETSPVGVTDVSGEEPSPAVDRLGASGKTLLLDDPLAIDLNLKDVRGQSNTGKDKIRLHGCPKTEDHAEIQAAIASIPEMVEGQCAMLQPDQLIRSTQVLDEGLKCGVARNDKGNVRFPDRIVDRESGDRREPTGREEERGERKSDKEPAPDGMDPRGHGRT